MQPKAHVDAELSGTQLENLAKSLTEKRLELANGSYGVSETTGEPIAYARLKLIPWARTDVENRD